MTQTDVIVNDSLHRFEMSVDGAVAFLDFRVDGDRIVLVHTDVPPSLEGRGVGSRIVRAPLAHARERDLTVIPQCPFVRSYLERHLEEAERTKIESDR